MRGKVNKETRTNTINLCTFEINFLLSFKRIRISDDKTPHHKGHMQISMMK